ncbi:hypothetical protein RVW00_000163 [Enterobacter bugandensis]|nr:hypothetical protein [Enterobacter bugandensis]
MNIAAVWEMIFAGEWGRIWWGITHAHWANVWAGISALFTALAAMVACLAMLRWSKQDELKAKLAFKTAVCVYSDQLTILPNKFNNANEIEEHIDALRALTDQLVTASNAFFACENTIFKHKEVVRNWRLIAANHEDYVLGKKDNSIMLNASRAIRQLKFVY